MTSDEAAKFASNYLMRQQLKVDLHSKACKAFLNRVVSEEAKETGAKKTRMGAAARWRFAVSNMAAGVLMRSMGVAATRRATFTFSDFPPTYSSTAARKRTPSAKAGPSENTKLTSKNDQGASKDRPTTSDSADLTNSFNTEVPSYRGDDELVEESPVPPPRPKTKRYQRKQDSRKDVENADGEGKQKALLAALTQQASQNLQQQSRYGSRRRCRKR